MRQSLFVFGLFLFSILYSEEIHGNNLKNWGFDKEAKPAQSKTNSSSCFGIKTPSHLMVGLGAFDVDKSHPRLMLQVEYRWDIHFRHIRPLFGFFAATEGNCYVFAGVSIDAFLGKKVVLTPSFAPGLYYHGNGKHLGFPLNFRSALELSYVCDNQARWGAQFNHISNAGMLWKNPGADSLVLFYSIPLGK